MKIALIADSHFDERSRFQECIRLHDWIAEDLAERRVDLVLHAGDLYEGKSTPAERAAAAQWLVKVANHGPVLLVRGNHDALEDLPLLGKLHSEHSIIVEESAGVHHVHGAAVACLAWPRKAQVLAATETKGEEGAQVAAEALRGVLAGMGAQLRQWSGPRILLAHAMVSGSVTSTGQPLVGCDMELSLSDLALANAHFVALGHIHKSQSWEFGGAPIVYPGSPRRTAFGELEVKGYVVAQFEDRQLVGWEFIEAPATPMLLLTATWDTESRALLGEHRLTEIEGAEVRLRYAVPADQRDAAKAAAEQYRRDAVARGAIRVQIEEQVIAETRARAPEVAAARTVAEKLEAYWHAKGIDLGNRKERVLGRLAELEGA